MKSGQLPLDRPRTHRLAVLPLQNISANSGDDYFADGLTEELISSLSKIPGLSVIARTSAMRFKGTDKTIAQVADELAVRSVVEGSVRKSGRKLRIAVRLIDAPSQGDLWSENYDRELKDVFAIQRDIAKRIGRALKIRLARREEREVDGSSAAVGNAYDLYLQGRFQWNLRTESGLRRSIELFTDATERDRTFALAYCGIADAWAQIGWLEYSAPTEAFPRAREAAEKALSIDDHLAEAHASLGFVRFLYERDWGAAEKELQRAIALNPGYPTGHQFYADYLKAMGRFDEAIAEMRKALELDPVSMAVNTGFGHVLYLARNFDGAIEQYPQSTRDRPGVRASTSLVWTSLSSERTVRRGDRRGTAGRRLLRREHYLARRPRPHLRLRGQPTRGSKDPNGASGAVSNPISPILLDRADLHWARRHRPDDGLAGAGVRGTV